MSSVTNDNPNYERILPAADIALFRRVHELCGAGVVRDEEWWQLEAEYLGSDWDGIHAMLTKIIAESHAAAMERYAIGYVLERAA